MNITGTAHQEYQTLALCLPVLDKTWLVIRKCSQKLASVQHYMYS